MGAQINKHVGVDAADVVLIDPSGDTKGFNTGLGYLSGSLIQKGYRVKVFDFNNNKNNIQARINAIERLDAKYIGFSIKTFTLDSAIEISNSIKKEKKVFIAGGPHITLDPTAFLENNTKFDFGVIFEGEKTLLDLVEGKDFKNIENVAWRQEKSIIVNQKQKYIDNFIRDLDALPFPNYDFFDSLPENRVIYDYPLITSRGCPYPCVYCSVGTVIGKIWRARSPKNIVEELFYAKEKYKSSKFSILDDNFTLGMARAKEICQKIIDEKLNMDWSCPNGVRADRLDEELLGLMKDAGCTSINIGIESLVPDVFDKINKKEKIDQIVNVIEIAKRKKIKINGFFIRITWKFI
ncbi:MAG: radical SAM protein [Nitrososphaeria archaeon]